MSYGGIASQIRSYCSTLKSSNDGISDSKFGKWTGKAHDTLTSNLTDAKSTLSSQISALENFANTLDNVQKYVDNKGQISNKKSALSGMDPEKNASSIATLNSQISALQSENDSLASSIRSSLSGISSTGKKYSIIETKAPTSTGQLSFDVKSLLSKFTSGSLKKMADGDSLYNYYSKSEVQSYLNEITSKYKGRDAAVNSALAIINLAAQKGLKLDYDWGGGHGSQASTDNVATGVDCSGFASWAVNQGAANGFTPRATGSLISTGAKVSYSQCKPGDLLVKHSNGSGHVYLVIQNDVENQKFIVAEASGSKVGVKLSEYAYSKISGTYVARDMSSIYGN